MNKKGKVLFYGFFGVNMNPIDGQGVKAKNILQSFTKQVISDLDVIYINTADYKFKIYSVIKLLFKIIFDKDIGNLVIIVGRNGTRILARLVVLAGFLGINVHWITIGNWLDQEIKKSKWIENNLSKDNITIYAETKKLMNKIIKINEQINVVYFPNFKIYTSNQKKNNIKFFSNKDKKNICFLSRVRKEKGVVTAIESVIELNNNGYDIELHIYGDIYPPFKKEFDSILNLHSFIKYKGVIDHNKVLDIIKRYYLLILPTEYWTEGIPGVILDSFHSQVPILISRWESFNEIIIDEVNGFGFDFGNKKDFTNKLKCILNNQNLRNKVSENCLGYAEIYSEENIINILVENVIVNI